MNLINVPYIVGIMSLIITTIIVLVIMHILEDTPFYMDFSDIIWLPIIIAIIMIPTIVLTLFIFTQNNQFHEKLKTKTYTVNYYINNLTLLNNTLSYCSYKKRYESSIINENLITNCNNANIASSTIIKYYQNYKYDILHKKLLIPQQVQIIKNVNHYNNSQQLTEDELPNLN
ncbi:MAG: hypothetical protein ACYDDE_00405 [bacterium]